MVKKKNTKKWYEISMHFKDHSVKVEIINAENSNIAFEMFCDKNSVKSDEHASYKIVCLGDIRPMHINPYSFGKCLWQVFEKIKELPISTTIKIDAIKNRIPVMYSVKTISQALNTLERDGYLKFESRNCAGENIYIKFGQVKS